MQNWQNVGGGGVKRKSGTPSNTLATFRKPKQTYNNILVADQYLKTFKNYKPCLIWLAVSNISTLRALLYC